MQTLDDLLDALWKDYSIINSRAGEIHKLLTDKGENPFNDHIAFRTFNLPSVGIDKIAQHFERFGYEAKGEYNFKQKKLYAKHYEHPEKEKYPLVFISELKVEEFSEFLRNTVRDLVLQVNSERVNQIDFPVATRLWQPPSLAVYEKLKEESEYAAWMSVFGFRANHFTVRYNTLDSFDSFQAFNQWLMDNGFEMNMSGGLIKGTPEELLEQSSTMAHPIEVEYADQTKITPACYYEFANRYPDTNGDLYMGFVTSSADKIFESTDNK